MENKYLLVCEGQTDFFVIHEISNTLSAKTGKKISVVPLSPQQDATTGAWPRHGWTAIRRWCKLYGNKTEADLADVPPLLKAAALRRNWRALLQLQGADGIIIQIDTDIAEEISDLPPFNNAINHRSTHVRDAVEFWLNDNLYAPKIYLALTTYALESWILATHPKTDPVFSDLPRTFNIEDVENIEDRLIGLGYKSKKINGQIRLSKKESLFKQYALRVAGNLDMVRAEAKSADELCKHLET